jgi:D-beta-D-heptose 7-phosphate kinase/D-beta-D-heptose 1-phosphate adenosyltransferase
LKLKAFSHEYFKALKEIRKKRIIFFNGCFDIIHPGHLALINKALSNKNLTNNAVVICGINSDESAKSQKKSHPLVNNETSRAEMLLALGVDHVIIFDDATPKNVIMSLMPDLVITTSEYSSRFGNCEDLDFCRGHDIDVISIATIAGYSTSSIYRKIEEQVKAKVRESLQ